MAAIFQLRRGSGSVSLVDGELYVNKGPDSLQYSVGDREITLAKLDELNTGSLNLYGDITASNLYVTGNVTIGGNITIGDQTTDSVTINADLDSDLIPNTNKTYSLGTNSKWYKNLYIETISSSFISGAIAGIGSLEEFSTSVDSRLDYLEGPFSTSVDSRIDLLESAMSGSNRLYVSPEGSDTNNGREPHTPFKTIKAAVASLGDAVYSNVKRYTIFVGSGNYTEQNPIAVPPGVAIVGDTLRTVRLTAANPTKDFFHVHDSNYFYGLRFLDLQHPAFAFSFPSSTATSTISGGNVSTISVVYSMNGYTDGTNQDLGIIIEGPNNNGTTATATADVVGGVITQINVVNGGTNYSSTEKPHISIPAPLSKRPVITTSPYIQNCSSITGPFNTSGVKVLQALPYDEATFNIDEQGAGGGIRIDGNLVHPLSPLESFVADAFTQVNQGGPGHLVINKGYAQFVSCFTTFCTYGFKTANGGFANISNSVIDFGKEGLISKTYFPTTYNTGSSLETKTSQVSGFVIDENGAGYTGSIAGVTIIGGGASVQATAEATVNANGSIDEIVLLTPGSGYTSQPSVTIDTPTGPGAILATTVAGKALISGVSEMLISLETGIRGVDISSNMILNGVDYLVTDVAEVSGHPNNRRVTTYPAPPSITTNDQIKFHQLSNISTGGLVMEYVGSGVTYNSLPKYGGVPIRTREIVEFAPGRVFYSTVDNIGNLKIGDFFSVNQLTGEVTIDANSFNLSGLNAIGPFRRNGVAVGVVLQEVSNNTTLLNSQGLYGEDTTPTQFAVKEYVNAYTSSANNRLSNLEIASSSAKISIAELNTYTSSLKQAITVTGTDVSSTTTIKGNLVVQGTQTTVDSTTIQLGDNIIELNGSGVANAGLLIKDSTSPNTLSGSLLWDTTLNYWKAGNVYLESKILLAGGDGVLSGSTDFNAFSTSVDLRIANASSSLHDLSGSTYSVSSSLDLRVTNVSSSLYELSGSSYNASSSFDRRITNVSSSLYDLSGSTYSISSSFDTRITNNSSSLYELSGSTYNVSSSFDIKFIGVQSSTASLNTFSASVLSDLTSIHQTTASLNLFSASVTASFLLMTASIDDHEDRIAYIEGMSGITGGNPLTPLNIFSASINTFTSSTNTRLSNIEAATASYETTGRGIVSGSSQIVPLLPSGVISSSIQILGGSGVWSSSVQMPVGVVSGSSQITYTNISSIPSGIVSGSSQILNGSTIHSSSIGDYQFNSIGVGTAASTTAGEIRAIGDITAYYSSDERLKENITPISNALEKVNQISGNTYDWKEGYNEIHSHKGNDVGVIAQEIESILPQIVTNRDNGYKAVQYEKIIPLLIEAIKELSTKIDRLENK